MKRYLSINSTIYEIVKIKPYSVELKNIHNLFVTTDVPMYDLVSEFKRQYKIKANTTLATDFISLSGSQLSTYVSRSKTDPESDVSTQGALGVMHSLILGLEVTKSMMLVSNFDELIKKETHQNPTSAKLEDFDLA